MYWKAKLQQMVDVYKTQIPALEKQVLSLTDKMTDIQEQVEAVDTVTQVNSIGMTQVLEVKRLQYQASLGGLVTITYGSGYGTTNVNNWYLYWHGDKTQDPVVPGRIVYRINGPGWDNDSTILCLLQEFGFMQDYVKIDINQGLYGLESMLNLLDSAKSKLEDLISKYSTAKRRFESYINQGASGCLLKPYFE